MKGLSKLTVSLGIYVIISASFALQVMNFLAKIFGRGNIKIALFFLFFAVFLFCIIYNLRKKVPLVNIALSLIVFALAYLLILRQPFFAEKFHVLEYGFLGFLALKDHSAREKRVFQNIFFAGAFVLAVSLLDEGFQAVLPYRVFEVRDITTNLASGLLGISLLVTLRSFPCKNIKNPNYQPCK